MSIVLHCGFLMAFIIAINGSEAPRVAIASLTPRSADGNQNIYGTVVFTETDDGVRIEGTIIGLPVNKYGFHVHEQGDITTCDASGAHFNPDETDHGGREHPVRHVGDLGNVEFVGTTNPVATINIVDKVLSLRGRNNILGRTLVLHEEEDDLGLGGQPNSLTTGNAGARVACGVIGISAPIDSWNAAVTISPSLILFFTATVAVYMRW